jgi:hypothetical protein
MLFWKNRSFKQQALQVEGARQVGKTSLIREFCKNEFNRFIEINLLTGGVIVTTPDGITNYVDTEILNNKKLVIEEYVFKTYTDIQNSDDNCIFIDEIQETPAIYNSIRRVARTHKVRYIVSGSFLGMITKNKEFFLPVGDLTVLRLTTLKFSEFERAFKGKFKTRLECFYVYIKMGGYPRLAETLLNENKIFSKDTQDLLNLILKESVRYLDDIKFQTSIRELYRCVARTLLKEKTGLDDDKFISSLNTELQSNAKMKFKVQDTAIYMRWLIETGIADYADVAVDGDFENIIPCKRLYFNDTFFLNTIRQETSKQDDFKGKLFETYAFKVLTDEMSGSVYNPTFITLSKTSGELDFCSYGLQNVKKKYGFEIKSGKADYKTGKRLLKDKTIDELVVFRADLGEVPKDFDADIDNHITVLPLLMMEEFIANLNKAEEVTIDILTSNLF